MSELARHCMNYVHSPGTNFPSFLMIFNSHPANDKVKPHKATQAWEHYPSDTSSSSCFSVTQ